MALPTQLKAARMTNDTPANTIDNRTNDFEAAVTDVLGLTAGTAVNSPSYFKLNVDKMSIPMAKALGAEQSTTFEVELAVALDTEEYDTDTMHSNTVNNHRLTIFTTGTYLVVAHCAYPSDGIANRKIKLYKNGSTEVARTQSKGTAVFIGELGTALDGLCLVHVLPLVATDYIHMTFTRDTSTGINIVPPTFLAAHRIGS